MSKHDNKPIRLGIVGVGGWAVKVTNDALAQGPKTSPAVQLVAVSTTSPDKHAARLTELKQKGVQVAKGYEDLFQRDDIDAVWLPVPIHLHRPYTEQALAAGKAVMSEKPVAGTIQDTDAMITARDRSGLPVAVGYPHVYDPIVAWIKRRLLDGVLGKLEFASLLGTWPRHTFYYVRNNWAGKFKVDGAWVLDSPAHNALAHFLHLGQFILGPTYATSAVPRQLEAETYRIQACENYDTVTMRARLDTGVEFLVLLTHACQQQLGPILKLHGTAGTLTWDNKGIVIETGRGKETVSPSPAVDFDMLERFGRLVRGQSEESRVIGTLEMARAQVLTINAISEAAPVIAVPRDVIVEFDQKWGDESFHYLAIKGLDEAYARCLAERKLLHETKAFPWTVPAGRLDLKNYTEFHGPKTK